ncbi:hypothetical protein E2C01_085805 [Portunus trituberculatus]|uniref:Uncharacterized protein n=1 Tax=Portunus trituberculatus TaxID=210409 RepID=A0A5B7JEN0_PORTR|nr:hypothetical protein [Portunus trituberculatus]
MHCFLQAMIVTRVRRGRWSPPPPRWSIWTTSRATNKSASRQVSTRASSYTPFYTSFPLHDTLQ